MRQQIIRLSVAQTAKVLAIMYGAMGLLFLPFLILAAFAGPEEERLGLGFAIALPLLYAAFGYVFTAIGCAIYNVVARAVGGIEVVVEASGEPAR